MTVIVRIERHVPEGEEASTIGQFVFPEAPRAGEKITIRHGTKASSYIVEQVEHFAIANPSESDPPTLTIYVEPATPFTTGAHS